jgi:hypothetical protein
LFLLKETESTQNTDNLFRTKIQGPCNQLASQNSPSPVYTSNRLY